MTMFIQIMIVVTTFKTGQHASASRAIPYSRPSTMSTDTSSSSHEEQSGSELPEFPDDQSLSVMVQHCCTSLQTHSRQLQKIQDHLTSLTKQVSSILDKLSEQERQNFNLKDAHLEVND